MIVLGIFFLGLWIAGLFYANTTRIHIALMVSLLFFMRSVMVTPEVAAKSEEADV